MATLSLVALATLELDDVDLLTEAFLDDVGDDRGSLDVGSAEGGRSVAVLHGEDAVECDRLGSVCEFATVDIDDVSGDELDL